MDIGKKTNYQLLFFTRQVCLEKKSMLALDCNSDNCQDWHVDGVTYALLTVICFKYIKIEYNLAFFRSD